MKASNDLHDLICSLNSTEKAYIKKYASIYSKNKNNYFALLEAISKQEEYDEEAILLKFRRESFVKHFAVTKNQLYELILKLLRQYHQENSPNAMINAAIENSKLLYDRGLIASSLKQLDKAYKLADELVDYSKLNEIIDIKRHYIGQFKANDWLIEIEGLLQQKEALAKAEIEHVFYAKIYYQLLFFVRKYFHIRTEAQAQELQQILPNGILPTIQHNNHFYIQLHFWNIKNIYHFLTEDFEKAQAYMGEIIDLWERHPQLLQKEPEKYIAALNNYSNSAVLTKDWESVYNLSNKIAKIDQQSFRLKAVIFENTAMWKINALFNLKQYDKLLDMVPEIEASFQLYKDAIHEVRHLLISYSVASIHLLFGNYNKALDYINNLLHMKQVALREDIQLFVNMLFFWTHYRLDNLVFLENSLSNYKRKIKKNGLLNDLEELQLKHLMALTRVVDSSSKLSQLDLFQQELHQLITKNPSLTMIIDNFLNLNVWIESIRKNTSMRIVLDHEKQP